MKAWHFSNKEKKLGYNDNREIKIGETLSVDHKPILCKRGLHGSIKIIDALQYASGPLIWKVDITGKVKKGDDKIVGQHRKALEGDIDISDILREFERWCALQVVHLWDAPQVVIDYLKTGDENLRMDAWYAVRAAGDAWAAEDAAGAAARAAMDATSDAEGTVWYAAGAAARAAMDAASDAFMKKANRKLTQMVNKRLKETK